MLSIDIDIFEPSFLNMAGGFVLYANEPTYSKSIKKDKATPLRPCQINEVS
jgi:hypothetical protein